MLKNVCDQLNFVKQCRKYNLTLWECPQFLTILFGLVTIVAMISTYIIGNRIISDPEVVALIIIVLTAVLMVIGYLIIKSFTSLAEANQMKSEFVSITSHQLRTPLSIIKWTLNAIMDEHPEVFSTEQKSYLLDMERSNQQMIDLVNDLLNVSRIEQKRLRFEPEKINLVTITQNLLKQYAPFAEKSRLTINTTFKNGASIAWADPNKIKVVMQNLLDNAIRYSADKGHIITISIKHDGDQIMWEIRDEGIGIPKEEQNKIFQKFFRSQNTARYKTKGTGLGLFIAKAFILSSNGKIGFKSQEEKGTTFWFELPTKPEA